MDPQVPHHLSDVAMTDGGPNTTASDVNRVDQTSLIQKHPTPSTPLVDLYQAPIALNSMNYETLLAAKQAIEAELRNLSAPSAVTPPSLPTIVSSVDTQILQGQTLPIKGQQSAILNALPAGGPVNTSSGFPSFDDGDIIIVTPCGKNWKLHSSILRNSSGIIRNLLDVYKAAKLTKKQVSDGRTVVWKLEMRPRDLNPDDERFCSFTAVDILALPPFEIQDPSRGEPQYVKIYDNFFRCLYHLSPDFNSSLLKDGEAFVLEAIFLLQAAEYLQATPAVRMAVETFLHRSDQVLWRHIYQNPEVWAELSIRLQSPKIFREAMSHLVGRFDLKGDLTINKEFLRSQPNGVMLLTLLQSKHEELSAKKISTEIRISEYFPIEMLHSSPSVRGGKESYASQVFWWMALTLARQFINSAYMSNRHHTNPDGGVVFYRAIGTGGDAYLRQNVLDTFHESFCTSDKSEKIVRSVVESIKEKLKPIVAPLLVCHLHLENGSELEYLTCAEILDEELPWVVAEPERREKSVSTDVGLGMGFEDAKRT